MPGRNGGGACRHRTRQTLAVWLAVLISPCLWTPRRGDAAWARESLLHRTSSSRQLRVGPDLTVTLIGRSSAKDDSTRHVRRRRYRRRRPRSSTESRPSCAVPMRGSGPALHFGCCMEFTQARTLRLRLVWGAADRPTDAIQDEDRRRCRVCHAHHDSSTAPRCLCRTGVRN
jgi:hypothetical protein